MHLLKTWSFYGENICLTGLLWGRKVTDLCFVGSCPHLCIQNPNPLRNISYLREGPDMTQPVLRNKFNRQGGGGFHASPLLVSSTSVSSLGTCHASRHCCIFPRVLCSLLAPHLLGHWSPQVPKPHGVTYSPQWVEPPLCFLKLLSAL